MHGRSMRSAALFASPAGIAGACGMKERPIIFSAPMVRAILEGTKTQTRRIVKLQPRSRADIGHYGAGMPFIRNPDVTGKNLGCPYGQPGDRLWVRETWAETDRYDGTPVVAYRAGGCIAVGCDGFSRDGTRGKDVLLSNLAWKETPYVDRWRSPIHMPRWASRITLEVTGVRFERLQAITEADARAEGVEGVDPDGPVGYIPSSDHMGRCRYQYANLWESINGSGTWDANPWVWVVEFRRVTGAAEGGA